MEVLAQECIKRRDYNKALEIYNQLLQNPQNGEDQIVSYLLDRSECLYEIGQFEMVVNDCKSILKSLGGTYDYIKLSRARIRLVQALFILNRVPEAEQAVKEWMIFVNLLNDMGESKMVLQNALKRFFSLKSKQEFDVWISKLEAKLCNVISQSQNVERDQVDVFCIYCNISFKDKAELSSHCLTQEHETMIMSDEGHDWHWRAPPRGFNTDSYVICENWKEFGSCRYGIQCVEAHGEGELAEWKERFKYREMKLMRAKEKEMFGKSYTEELLEKWAQTSNPRSVMTDHLSGVDDDSSSCSATVTSKNSVHEWTFTLRTVRPLKTVALLQDTHRNHFCLSKIECNGRDEVIANKQEFLNLNAEFSDDLKEHKVFITFQTNIFGTFRQSVVFDFGSEPVLVKHLCVDVIPDTEVDKVVDIRKEMTLSIAERWTRANSDIVAFTSDLVNQGGNVEFEKALKALYPCPEFANFTLSNATITERKFTRNNYKERMHELLWAEEIERYALVSQYNLTTRLQVAHSYILAPNSMAASTAKYSSNGELFASIFLGKKLSEDTSEGRLILMHCNAIFLRPNSPSSNKIYEAMIEDKTKSTIYLRLSAETVADLQLNPNADIEVQIQFQLNRVPYCEWHFVVDKFPNVKLIFPDTFVEPMIPWSPSRQWSSSLDSRLNLKQKEAIVTITTPISVKIPPILVIGPFGTGKTFTLAQAIKELIKDKDNKILLCTHSNSAADLYIKDYLDLWVEEGNESARPFRIYYHKRWVATVSPVVQKYCAIKQTGNNREFQMPSREDIDSHQIIVVTLSTSVYLTAMGLLPGVFTHILVDEAAQALECETITPLALATDDTRIVLAGDHMQLGPDIFSKFAKDRNLHISLLERLYDYYPAQFPCKILLCENYRAHETIIQFTSESFYDQKLVSSSKQPAHFKFYPLTFFTTRGEDVQDKNSTAFYNNSEVYEVVERISELKRKWPEEWGKMTDQSIGVVTPYSDQVFRIRSELRKRKIDVCVERVLNVQGKQFRAIILSTVRTRKTCTNKKSAEGGEVDYGFLSNSKLLNTAITRAQSLVAVVGDPIALCSLGRCSKVWERFIQICNTNGSLYGITWTQLKFQLDGIELKKIYTLNPLAPEFIPRKYRDIAENPPKPIAYAPSVQFQLVIPPPQPPQPQADFRGFPVFYPTRPVVYNLTAPPPVQPQIPLVVPPVDRRLLHPPRPLLIPQIGLQNGLRAFKSPPGPKLIQFMNNVHFPEAQMPQLLNDCVSLLPQQMSLADMIVQPPNVQEHWYNYLRNTAGVEAAEKFKYLLMTSNQKGTRIPEAGFLGRTTPLSSSGSPTFNWYDSPSSQINFNKPIYMRDVETCNGSWPIDPRKSNPLYQRHSNVEVAQANKNGIGGPGNSNNGVKCEEGQLQKKINEEFAKLDVNNRVEDWYDVFKQSFSNGNEPPPQQINGSFSKNPKFQPYFS